MDQKDELLKKFGRYLTALRKERALTIEELAAASGLTPEKLHRIEAGKVDVLFTTVVMLSMGLDITPGELLQSLDPD
ncbi:MAG TPA: helix-turn-helix transcriptional regulator [Puia sp.]|jgi:transcriptional regulator with XRE-family HTH domain